MGCLRALNFTPDGGVNREGRVGMIDCGGDGSGLDEMR